MVLMAPGVIDTVKVILGVREPTGSMVTFPDEYDTCASFAGMLKALPVAGEIVMLPVPACTGSLNTSTRLVLT